MEQRHLDVIDLIIQTLMEHEKTLDQLIDALRIQIGILKEILTVQESMNESMKRFYEPID